MNEKSNAALSAAPAPLEQVEQSVHSDLQYVSLQLEGQTYGGWYRLLPDGRMELLALANMLCERRAEGTPIEQARGMLADFIRAARVNVKKTESAAGSAGHHPVEGTTVEPDQESAAGTLGDLLYADASKTRVSEKEWVGLVDSIAAGDQAALRALFERTHRVVFTLLLRLTHNAAIAENLTLEVFHDVWRQATTFDARSDTVLGWIMNQARSRAIDHLQFELRQALASEAQQR